MKLRDTSKIVFIDEQNRKTNYGKGEIGGKKGVKKINNWASENCLQGKSHGGTSTLSFVQEGATIKTYDIPREKIPELREEINDLCISKF